MPGLSQMRLLKKHACSKCALKLFEGALCVGVLLLDRGCGARSRASGNETLNLANGHAAAGNFSGEGNALVGVENREERARVSGGNAAVGDQILNEIFEAEEAERIGNRGAIFSGSLGHLLLREMELVAEALKSARLLDGIQIFALEIFHQRHLERHFLGNVADDYGHA